MQPDWEAARDGIRLLLNNRVEEAEQLFEQRKDSIPMAAGHCFLTFMNAMMTFEEDKLAAAAVALKEVETRCSRPAGWLRSLSQRWFPTDPADEADRLEAQVALADAQVCAALLALVSQHDGASRVRAAWSLRRAWLAYQAAHTRLTALHRALCPGQNIGVDFPSCPGPSVASPAEASACDWSVPSPGPAPRTPNGSFRSPLAYLASFAASATQPSTVPQVAAETVSRLLAAVSFGYGVFQLAVSLLPPSLLRVVHLLGFHGDRRRGIAALMFARLGQDMRAPLASLALLWYHTIVRPFLSPDRARGAGLEAATLLVREARAGHFAQSALFLFFQGRVHRLKGRADLAMTCYSKAAALSRQREVSLLCRHEAAWCRLCLRDFAGAGADFTALAQDSRWSTRLYLYLAAVCGGASSRPLPAATPVTTTSPLESFVERRLAMLPTEPAACRLLGYELLFLWNSLPTMGHQELADIAQDCAQEGLEPMKGLRLLLAAACLSALNQWDEAVSAFRSCLALRADSEDDVHVTAFACLELGLILSASNQTRAEGLDLLTRAQSLHGFDFESRLHARLQAAIRAT